jgi:hypothetical protein
MAKAALSKWRKRHYLAARQLLPATANGVGKGIIIISVAPPLIFAHSAAMAGVAWWRAGAAADGDRLKRASGRRLCCLPLLRLRRINGWDSGNGWYGGVIVISITIIGDDGILRVLAFQCSYVVRLRRSVSVSLF